MEFFTEFKVLFFSIVCVQLFLLCNFTKSEKEITIKILKVKVLFILIMYNCSFCIYNLLKINN
jgi:hypothetical protein